MWRIVVVEESGAQIVVRRERRVDSGSEGRQYMGETNGDRWCLGGSRRTRGSWCEGSERYNIVQVAGKPPRLVIDIECGVQPPWKCTSTKKSPSI